VNPPRKKLGVLLWYRIFCGFSALFYLGIGLVGFSALLWDPNLTKGVEHPEAFKVFMPFFCGFLVLLGGVYLVSFFFKRSRGAWTFHLVMICLGLANGFTLLPCIFLLIYWIQPETKAYFPT